MSFNDEKKGNNELDSLNLKSHLDTSLEQSGIRVSEDLINRTLEAIKQQSQNNNLLDIRNEKTKKSIPWSRYIRGVAGVAAAALIIFIGSQGFKGFYMRSAKNDASQEYDMSKGSESPESESKIFMENFDVNIQEASDAKETEFFTKSTAAVEKTEDIAVGITDDTVDMLTAAEGPDLTDPNSFGKAENLSLQDISAFTRENAKEIKITNWEGKSVTIESQEKIEEFYVEVNNILFAFSSGAVTDHIYYTIELKGDETTAYQNIIWIGDSVTVRYVTGDDVIDDTYIAVNHEDLLKVMTYLIDKHSE